MGLVGSLGLKCLEICNIEPKARHQLVLNGNLLHKNEKKSQKITARGRKETRCSMSSGVFCQHFELEQNSNL